MVVVKNLPLPYSRIFEPGGFRTDFAGSSQPVLDIRPEYESTVGQAARFQRDYNGKQPGDPAKAAAVILKVVGMDNPPLRLLLGSDAVEFVLTADAQKIESDRKWRGLSSPADFEAAPTAFQRRNNNEQSILE